MWSTTLQSYRQPMVSSPFLKALQSLKHPHKKSATQRLTSISQPTQHHPCPPFPCQRHPQLQSQRPSKLIHHQQQTPSSTHPTRLNNLNQSQPTPANQAPHPSIASSPSWTTPLHLLADLPARLALLLTNLLRQGVCRNRVRMGLIGNCRSSPRRVEFRSRAVVRRMQVRRSCRLLVGGVG
jgi:hypothetical protein